MRATRWRGLPRRSTDGLGGAVRRGLLLCIATLRSIDWKTPKPSALIRCSGPCVRGSVRSVYMRTTHWREFRSKPKNSLENDCWHGACQCVAAAGAEIQGEAVCCSALLRDAPYIVAQLLRRAELRCAATGGGALLRALSIWVDPPAPMPGADLPQISTAGWLQLRDKKR